MSFWTAIVIIVAITALASIIRSRHQASLGYVQDEEGKLPGGGPRREEELRAEIAMLRDRLEVIERITTEEHSHEVRTRKQLEAEIEDLRTRD